MRLSMTIIESRAKNRNIKPLFTIYKNYKTIETWECLDCHHTWSASVQRIKRCPKCSSSGKKKWSRLMIQNKISLRGATLVGIIDNKKISLQEKISIVCAYGHKWNTNIQAINRGHWCPQCKETSPIKENIVRKYFEYFLGDKFERKRHKWLNGLELDGYSEKLKIAFEYNGEQHYKYNKFFHRKRSLINQKEIDIKKIEVCKDNGITLIVIPYWVKSVDLGTYIADQCIKIGFIINDIPDLEKLGVYSPFYLTKIRNIAKSKNGKCISNVYIDSETPIKFMCEFNHIWETKPSNIFVGSWCPICSHDNKIARFSVINKKYDINFCNEIACSKRGKCISETYDNCMKTMTWMCEKNHIFNRNLASVVSGKWCQKCSKRRLYDINDIKDMAINRGLICISDTYHWKTNLKLKCTKYHVWETSVESFLQGSGCPYCKGKILQSIDDVKYWSWMNNGKCLDDVYVSALSNMTFQCANKHLWQSNFARIKHGGWCKFCYRLCSKERNTNGRFVKDANYKRGI